MIIVFLLGVNQILSIALKVRVTNAGIIKSLDGNSSIFGKRFALLKSRCFKMVKNKFFTFL